METGQRVEAHRDELQVLPNREEFVQRGNFGHEREGALRLRHFANRIVPRDEDVPLGGPQDSRDAPERRGLSRSIRSEKSNDLPGTDIERQSIDRPERLVLLDEAFDPEHLSSVVPLPYSVGFFEMQVEAFAQAVYEQVGKAIAGQRPVIEGALVATLANGHVLLEGVPGLGKTLLVRTLSLVLGLDYGRIQFTPDLMPSDVTGTLVYESNATGGGEFRLRKGPVFVGLLLADEINRTPPKTQAALLEAMEERTVTIDGTPNELPAPFLVFATQNPLEFEGTYPLPEAQQDRFLLKVLLDYPSREDELSVLRRHHGGFRPQELEEAGIQVVATPERLIELQNVVRGTTVEDKVFDYIQSIVQATRVAPDLLVGGSPRAGIALLNGSKALAQIRGRDFVIPDDVKTLAIPVLRHRVLLRPEAEIEGLQVDEALRTTIDAQEVPR